MHHLLNLERNNAEPTNDKITTDTIPGWHHLDEHKTAALSMKVTKDSDDSVRLTRGVWLVFR